MTPVSLHHKPSCTASRRTAHTLFVSLNPPKCAICCPTPSHDRSIFCVTVLIASSKNTPPHCHTINADHDGRWSVANAEPRTEEHEVSSQNSMIESLVPAVALTSRTIASIS